jgi:chromosome segregation ATPase
LKGGENMLEYNDYPNEYNQYSNESLREIELKVEKLDTFLSKITDVLNQKDEFLEKEKEIQDLKAQLYALSLLKDSEAKSLKAIIQKKNDEILQLKAEIDIAKAIIKTRGDKNVPNRNDKAASPGHN